MLVQTSTLFRYVRGFAAGALLVAMIGCGEGSGSASGSAPSGAKPTASTGGAASSAAAAGAAPGKTLFKTLGGKVSLELPAGAQVSSDGSVFGPGKLELAVYEEPAKTAKTDPASRKPIIEGRSTVKKYTSDAKLADGWLILFESDGALGFECGRTVGGNLFVFWSHTLPDEATRTLAVDGCKSARP